MMLWTVKCMSFCLGYLFAADKCRTFKFLPLHMVTVFKNSQRDENAP